MLKSKICLITGASKGIGKSIALAFAKEKGNLIIVARSMNILEEELIPKCIQNGAEKCKAIKCDLYNKNEVEEMCSKILEEYGHIDILVNNAGKSGSDQSPIDGNPDEWDKLMQLNTLSPMRITRRFVPGMVEKGGGIIINICSLAAVMQLPEICAYSATKYALRGWSLCCEQLLRYKNIKVICVNVGPTRTPIFDDMKQHVLLENAMEPEDVAEACLMVIKTSPNCIPKEITLNSIKPIFPHYVLDI